MCVSELFEMLDSVKMEIGILDWGIKMTTLPIQWNHSKADTIGTKDFVLYREVSLTQG